MSREPPLSTQDAGRRTEDEFVFRPGSWVLGPGLTPHTGSDGARGLQAQRRVSEHPALPMVAAAAAGAVALQLTLPLMAEGGLWPAANAAGRAAVLAGALVALARAGVAMTRGSPRGGVWGAGIRAWHVVVATATILATLLWRHPGRLVLNEVGFVLTAAPLGWVVARRAGRAAAVEAALALAALALASTLADVRRPPAIVEWAADSRFRWGTGWPADGWVLRHEIALDQPAPAAAMRLTAPLTREYAGPAWVLARVNDHDLGPATISGHTLDVDLPPAVVAGQTRLTFELRATQPDPNLRLIAFRVSRGATAGAQASSYYDSEARRWFPGTFNDAIGRPQAGIYVVELSVRT